MLSAACHILLVQPKEAMAEARLATQLEVGIEKWHCQLHIVCETRFRFHMVTSLLCNLAIILALVMATVAMIDIQPGLAKAWGRLGRAALMLGQEEEVTKLKI